MLKINVCVTSTMTDKFLTFIWSHISTTRNEEDIECQSVAHPWNNHLMFVVTDVFFKKNRKIVLLVFKLDYLGL